MILSARKLICLLLASAIALVSGLALIGYATGNAILTRWIDSPAVPAMAPNTAACFLAAAIAIILLALNGNGGGPFVPAPK